MSLGSGVKMGISPQGQSSEATRKSKMFQAPQKISFTFHYLTRHSSLMM